MLKYGWEEKTFKFTLGPVDYWRDMQVFFSILSCELEILLDDGASGYLILRKIPVGACSYLFIYLLVLGLITFYIIYPYVIF